MPQWTVEGAHKVTGEDQTLLVEVPTAAQAREWAQTQQIVVSDVRLSAPTEGIGYRTAESVTRTSASVALLSAARACHWFAFGWFGLALLEFVRIFLILWVMVGERYNALRLLSEGLSLMSGFTLSVAYAIGCLIVRAVMLYQAERLARRP